MPTCLGLHMLEERQAMHKTFEIPLDIPDVMIEKVGTDRHGDFVMTVKSTIEGTHCHICGKKITQVYGDDKCTTTGSACVSCSAMRVSLRHCTRRSPEARLPGSCGL